MSSNILSFINTKKYYLLVLIIIILGSVGLYKFFNKEPIVQTTAVEKAEFLARVSVTGKVVPVRSVDLAFESSGKISSIYKKVGDSVNIGDTIAILNSTEVQASLDKAKASLAGEKATLSQLLASQDGATEDTTAKRKLVDSILGGFTSSDDAIRNKVDQFFSNADTMNPKILFAFNDYGLKEKINEQRIIVEETLEKWETLNSRINVDNVSGQDAEKARGYLNVIKSFLNDVSRAVNSFEPNNTLSQATIDKYKSDVASARTNINNSLSSLTVVEDGLRGTVSNKEVQEARVKSAEADVASIEARLSKTILRSPIKGVITVQNAKEGEIAISNTPVVSIISSSNFQIEAYITESDIAKVKIGQPADTTLDAYRSSVVFKALVSYIDPAETIIEGVATYKTTLIFNKADSRIKSGMTANIDIETDRREEVIMLPQRLITETNGEKFVTIKEGDVEVIRKIQTGKVDDRGQIEIISGLSEGEVVVAKTQ